jgi:hypothetical protein
LIDEVASVEKIEAGLNELIERRARGAKTGRERANAEADWDRMRAESRARRYRQAVLQQRADFHAAQIANHTETFTRLLERHTRALRACEEELGITTDEERKSA